MAGAGIRVFQSGEVLTASNVNTYLQDQVVARFADSTARTNAYGGTGEPTLAEGMLSYLDSDNTVYVYDGSVWKAVGVASVIDAKGDLLVGTADNTVARQVVGANGTVLMADSGQTNGIKWQDISGNGAQVLTGQTTNSTSYTDLATAGPSVTMTTGTTCLVFICCDAYNTLGVGNTAFIGVNISGATTRAADTDQSARTSFWAQNSQVTMASFFKVTGLTAGSNTFKVQYKVDGSTIQFGNRQIIVIPINP